MHWLCVFFVQNSGLGTFCKNLCACTTVVIIHTDPTVNHRLICTPGSCTSQHTKCMQLCSSQVNFYRKGGPRANAGLPSLLIRVVPHHLWCKQVLCCFAGALAASATDIQQSRVNNHCLKQVQHVMNTGASQQTQTVAQLDHRNTPSFVSQSLISLLLFNKNDLLQHISSDNCWPPVAYTKQTEISKLHIL